MESAAKTASEWFINPLQDYLYLDKDLYSENPDDERINTPVTVNEKNWTFRMPIYIEDLMKKEELLKKICLISEMHKTDNNGGKN